MKKVLKRSDYLNLIQDLIDTPHNTLDERMQLIEDEYLPDNQYFYENLYKDLEYIISRYDRKGDGDLAIENGDLVIERGDLKLTGKQTNLHGAATWCWMKIISKKSDGILPHEFMQRMERFETDFLHFDEYSPDDKAKLDVIVNNLKRYRAGKKSKVKRTDLPLWFKYLNTVIAAISGITAFIFRAEIINIFKFLWSLFQLQS